MDIGNTHIDGDTAVVGVLVIACLIALFFLRNRPQQPIEHPSIRAMRLIKAKWRVIPEGVVYFVPDDEDKVIGVDTMPLRDLRSHSRGRLVRSRNKQVEMALIRKDQDPADVNTRSFWTV